MQGRQWAYPALLASFPLFYFVFALWVNDKEALKSEFIAGFIFFVIVAIYLRFKNIWVEYLLVSGFFLHAFYDLTHDWYFINMGVPKGWGFFCALVDGLIGLYLLYYLRKSGQIRHIN